MQEPYSEAPARHAGPEPDADRGNTLSVATAGGHADPVLSSERFHFACRRLSDCGRQHYSVHSTGEHLAGAAKSKTWCMWVSTRIRSIPKFHASRRTNRIWRLAINDPRDLTHGTTVAGSERQAFSTWDSDGLGSVRKESPACPEPS